MNAPAYDLPHSGHIWGHAVSFLSATGRCTESHDDLVEYQDGIMFIRDLAHFLQISLLGSDYPDISEYGFHDDACDIILIQYVGHFLGIVVFCCECVLCDVLQDTFG